jgi:Ca-activated chloride channel family protein
LIQGLPLPQGTEPGFLFAQVLPALLLAPLSFWWLQRRAKNRRLRLQLMLGDRLETAMHQAQGGRLLAARACFSGALFFTILAWAQPTWGVESDVQKIRSADIVVCLDVSQSMLATDQRPSRLESARSDVDLLAQLAGGDRLALVHFAGQARLATPLTEDLDAFSELLELSQPSSIPVGGSDLGAALRQAIKALPDKEGAPQSVVILTDGEDWGTEAIASAQACADLKIPVHCIGYGSVLGSKIAVEAGFLQDSDKQDVISKLNSDILRDIVHLTDGRYMEAAVAADPMRTIYDEHIRKMNRRSRDGGLELQPINRYQWPLGFACFLWLLEVLLVRSKRK